jgi:hypothetical protein
MVPRVGCWAKDERENHKTIDAIPRVAASRLCGIVFSPLIAIDFLLSDQIHFSIKLKPKDCRDA